jgi:glycosyltransferase involved in cell wall biosynthesis
VLGISLLTLVPGEVGGIETYARELVAGLAADGFPFRAIVPPSVAGLGEGVEVEVAPEYGAPRTMPERMAAMARAAVDPRLRRRLRRYELVHFPLTVRLPPTGGRAVVSIMDLQHLDLPGLFSRPERAYRAVAYHTSLRRAERVVAISSFVRDRAVAHLGLEPDRVRVIHLGIDHARLTPGAEAREPFLLYPARAWPHKNHARLFEAFALVRRDRPDLRLVLTGGGALPALPDGVEARGLVSRDELLSLYRRAAALVFPSLYEGFGQPPLEAMACGCPVACSDATALPEVVGDAARLFDPRDPTAIAAAIGDVLDVPAEWTARGLARAAGFSWQATARAHEELYRELL